jgi:hypothetical protein
MDKRRMLDGAGLVLALTFVFSSMFIYHLDTVRDRQGSTASSSEPEARSLSSS